MRPDPQPCAQPPFRAQRARLLTIASNAAARVAQLQGLFYRPAPPPPPPTPPAPPTSGDTPPASSIPGCACACHHPRTAPAATSAVASAPAASASAIVAASRGNASATGIIPKFPVDICRTPARSRPPNHLPAPPPTRFDYRLLPM
jgi:hypothetical protein